jgi:Tfp pilus assembly protein PilE
MHLDPTLELHITVLIVAILKHSTITSNQSTID